MTKRFVTDEQYGKLQRKLFELSRRVDEGTLGYKPIMFALQTFIEGQIDRVYPVTIEYDQSLESMVKSGGYDYVCSSDVLDNFSITGEGRQSHDLVLINFNKALMTREHIIAGLEVLDLEPALVEDLLAFGIKYPDMQRAFPIICPGAVWARSSTHHVALFLKGTESQRDLSQFSFGDLCVGARFLARRK